MTYKPLEKTFETGNIQLVNFRFEYFKSPYCDNDQKLVLEYNDLSYRKTIYVEFYGNIISFMINCENFEKNIICKDNYLDNMKSFIYEVQESDYVKLNAGNIDLIESLYDYKHYFVMDSVEYQANIITNEPPKFIVREIEND